MGCYSLELSTILSLVRGGIQLAELPRQRLRQMKLRMVMASIFSSLLGMLSGCQKPSEEVALMVMEPQGEEITRAFGGVNFKTEDRFISIGNHKLKILPFVEQCLLRDSSHLCGVRFEVLDGKKQNPTLTYAVLGDGKSREAALRHAVQGWWAEFAVPLFGYLGGPKPEFGEWPFLFYVGTMAVRGAPPKEWADAEPLMYKQITPTLRPLVSRRPGTRIISLRLLIKPDGVEDMGSRINGEISPELVKSVGSLPWPRTDAGYIFYQTFVVRYKDE